jgi:hypothetical protein
MSVVSRVNGLMKMLNERGFDRMSSELSEIKSSTFYGMPFSQPTLSLPTFNGSKRTSRPSPSNPNTHPYEKGDIVVELNPTTMKEELMMWDGKKLIPKREIEKMIDTGAMREERFLSQYNNADLNVKKHMRPLIDLINSKKEFSSGKGGIPYPVRNKLSSISECLEKRGYILLVQKLKIAMDEYSRAITD